MKSIITEKITNYIEQRIIELKNGEEKFTKWSYPVFDKIEELEKMKSKILEIKQEIHYYENRKFTSDSSSGLFYFSRSK